MKPVQKGRIAMFARTTTLVPHPGQMDDLLRLFQDDYVPKIKQYEGFQGCLFLVDQERTKAHVVMLWKTADDWQAWQNDVHYSAARTKSGPLLAVEYTDEQTNEYEVAFMDGALFQPS
jgi:heme-degrading monooxygenase HmoA